MPLNICYRHSYDFMLTVIENSPGNSHPVYTYTWPLVDSSRVDNSLGLTTILTSMHGVASYHSQQVQPIMNISYTIMTIYSNNLENNSTNGTGL